MTMLDEEETRVSDPSKSTGQHQAPSAENTPEVKRALVILTEGPGNLDRIREQLSRAASDGLKLELFLDSALPRERRDAFKKMPNVEEVYEANLPEQGCYKLVTGCDAVLLPTLSLDTLNQISDLDGEDPGGRIACEALSQGKTVWCPEDTITASNSSQIKKKVQEKLEECGEMGLVSTPLEDFSFDFLETSGKSGELTEVTVCRDEPDPSEESGVKVSRDDDEFSAVVQTDSVRIGTTIGVRDVKEEVGGYIDHTLLNPDATREDIVQLCEEAAEYGFASVCINPSWVSLCDDLLKDTNVKVCTVIGFPLGATTTSTKVQEAKEAIANGADEVDMVINVGALKEGDYEYVKEDVRSVKEAVGDRTLKVILETGMLSDRQKAKASKLCKEAGADFVKTSTGFGPGGAKMNDIALMRRAVGQELGVKASGGVHNFEEAMDMISAGANRIGASAGVSIVSGEESDSDY
jgi:deoxyribose-phosphate aldolase